MSDSTPMTYESQIEALIKSATITEKYVWIAVCPVCGEKINTHSDDADYAVFVSEQDAAENLYEHLDGCHWEARLETFV